jgi:tetratricopeptide (TPR) repeat protein
MSPPLALPALAPASSPISSPTPRSLPGWYYAQNKKKNGPVSTVELQDLAKSGRLSPADMVLQEGTNRWRPAQEVPGLFPSVPATNAAANGAMPCASRPVAAPAEPASSWHYAKGKQKHGPISRDLLEQLATTGQLLREDMVLATGSGKWQPAGSIAGLFPSVSVDELVGVGGPIAAELPKLPARPRPASPHACPHCKGTAYCGRYWDADGLLARGPVCEKCKEKSGLASCQDVDKVTCAICQGKGFVSQDEESPERTYRRDAVAWRLRALAASDSGRYEEAIAAYSEALLLAPDFAEAYYERGWAYMAVGEAELAKADLAEAARLAPQYAEPADPSLPPQHAKRSGWLPRLFRRR